MQFRQAILKIDNQCYTLNPGRANSFDDIYVDFQNQPENGGERWSVFLHPKQDVTIQRLEIQFDLQLPPDARFFANGYQSWSESRLLGLNEAIPRLHPWTKKLLGYYGDGYLPDIPRGRGRLHSWTYTYVLRNAVPGIQFFGSLNESTGFTLFLYDQPKGMLRVRKDMDGLQLSHSFPALDFWTAEGKEQEIFDRYFQALEIKPPAPSSVISWTSWHKYFTRISEEILLQNLDGVANSGLPFSHFLIDDGWQTATGDWLSVKPAIPQGLGFLAQKIRERGLSPGLWFAPFVAAKHSDLARKHPEWLLKDNKGGLLKAAWNPYWGDWYYALDFYNNEVRNHLGGVFHTILDKWGYELLKLDFLYAVCLAPPPGKTRGQVMYEAMEFLRKLAGTKTTLACGVPLGAAFGLADFCRIGGNIHLAWEHRFLNFFHFRERLSTLASLRSMLGRWQLNGRAFHNDPDAFILRYENQKLTPEQQQTVLTVNALLGKLLFTSDDVSKYSPEQTCELEAALELRGSRVTAVFEMGKDVFRIDFENDGKRYAAYCNLTGRKKTIPAQASGGREGMIVLRPFETLTLSVLIE